MSSCAICKTEIVLRRSKRITRTNIHPHYCVSCQTKKQSKNWSKKRKLPQEKNKVHKETSDEPRNQTLLETKKERQKIKSSDEFQEENHIIYYPMGRAIRIKALKPDKKSRYSLMGYKYDETGAVYLTTVEEGTSKRLNRSEINDINAWIDKGMSPAIFKDIEDDIFMRPSTSQPGYVHVCDKWTMDFIYTYVPVKFFQVL